MLGDAHCGGFNQALVDSLKAVEFGVGQLDAFLKAFNNRWFKLLDSRSRGVTKLSQIHRPTAILQTLVSHQILLDFLKEVS